MQKTVLKYLGNERRHGFLKIDFSKMTFGQKIALKSTNLQKSKKTSKIATNLQFYPYKENLPSIPLFGSEPDIQVLQ